MVSLLIVVVAGGGDEDETTVTGKQRRCRLDDDDGDDVRDSNGLLDEESRSCSNERFNAIHEAIICTIWKKPFIADFD